MFEAAGLGRLVVRELGLGDPDVAPDLDSWRELVARIKAPKPILEIALVGKYIELPDAYLSVTEALRHAAWAHGVDAKVRWVDSEALTHDNLHERLDGAAGILVPGGFGHRGHRGQGPRRPLRPRAQDPVPRPVPRPAVRGHRVRPRGRRQRRRQLDRVRHVHRPPGDRLHARPARHGGQGRHDAARALPGQADAGLEGGRGLRPGGHLRAAPPPLRGEQPLPPDARGGRHAAVGPVARRPAGRDRRAAGPPVVRGQPVPPRVQVAAGAPAPAVRRVRRRVAGRPRRPRPGAAAGHRTCPPDEPIEAAT